MSSKKPRVAILAGTRTPNALPRDNFAPLSPHDLGIIVCREALYRAEVRPREVEECLLGMGDDRSFQHSSAHQIASLVGLGEQRPALAINRSEGAGLVAISLAFEKISNHSVLTVLAGGLESVTHSPWQVQKSYARLFYTLSNSRSLYKQFRQFLRIRPRHLIPLDSLELQMKRFRDQAEEMARKYGISREEQDKYALRSHRRCIQAQEGEKLAEEITPVHISPNYEKWVERDSCPQEKLTIESLADLSTYGDEDVSTVTSGNSCHLTDGAAAVVLMREDLARSQGLNPLGYIRSYAFAGTNRQNRGLGPTMAIHQALGKADLDLDKIDLMEIHHPTAAGILANQTALSSRTFAQTHLDRGTALGDINPEKVNVNGDAIALGHSMGATGPRLILSLLLELKRRNHRFGMVALPAGEEQGGAMVLERDP